MDKNTQKAVDTAKAIGKGVVVGTAVVTHIALKLVAGLVLAICSQDR